MIVVIHTVRVCTEISAANMRNLEGILAIFVNIFMSLSSVMAAKIFKDIAQGMKLPQKPLEFTYFISHLILAFS